MLADRIAFLAALRMRQPDSSRSGTLDPVQAPDPPSVGSAGIRSSESAPVAEATRASQPLGTIAVSSNKGGVGKTTVSTNLAVYLRALREDLPVLVVGLDDQESLDRMFRMSPPGAHAENLKHAWARRSFDGLIELGQYGVSFVPSPPDTALLKGRANDPLTLKRILDRTSWDGVVIFDTKSDLEALTLNAIHAADRVLIPVADRASLLEAVKSFRILEKTGLGVERGKVLFTLVDRRSRGDEQSPDLIHILMREVEERGWPRYRTVLSRSPRVESLLSADGRPQSILHAARGTAVHRQMRELTNEVLEDWGLAVPRTHADACRSDSVPASAASSDPSSRGAQPAPATASAPSRHAEARPAAQDVDWKSALLRGVWHRNR